jgi:hypothetical protein
MMTDGRKHSCGRLLALVLLAVLMLPAAAAGQSEWVTGNATPQEIYEKVTEAAQFLAQKGEPGLKEFEQTGGRFAWKNTYVFVTQCEEFFCLPNAKSREIGMQYSKAKCHLTGKLFILYLCGEIQGKPAGAWTEFWWPRQGFDQPQRKVAFMKPVPNMNYQVVADTFDDSTSLEALNRISAP